MSERDNTAFWEKYRLYIGSPEWAAKRLEVLARANGYCEEAGCEAQAIQVHHLTYKNFGAEALEDLQALCFPCHEAKHPGRDLRNGGRYKKKAGTKARRRRERQRAIATCPYCSQQFRKPRALCVHVLGAHSQPEWAGLERGDDEPLAAFQRRARIGWGAITKSWGIDIGDQASFNVIRALLRATGGRGPKNRKAAKLKCPFCNRTLRGEQGVRTHAMKVHRRRA